jgi:hypothetical protein
VHWDPTPSRPPLAVRVENERAFGGLGDRVKEGADAIHAKLGRVPMEQLLGKVRSLHQLQRSPFDTRLPTRLPTRSADGAYKRAQPHSRDT